MRINVLLNQWRNRFYNALQEHNWDNFVHETDLSSAWWSPSLS